MTFFISWRPQKEVKEGSFRIWNKYGRGRYAVLSTFEIISLLRFYVKSLRQSRSSKASIFAILDTLKFELVCEL